MHTEIPIPPKSKKSNELHFWRKRQATAGLVPTFFLFFSIASSLTRWIDNYGVLLGHFMRQTGVRTEDLRQYLGISEDYEDLE